MARTVIAFSIIATNNGNRARKIDSFRESNQEKKQRTDTLQEAIKKSKLLVSQYWKSE